MAAHKVHFTGRQGEELPSRPGALAVKKSRNIRDQYLFSSLDLQRLNSIRSKINGQPPTIITTPHPG
jgi:hypothetical protein